MHQDNRLTHKTLPAAHCGGLFKTKNGEMMTVTVEQAISRSMSHLEIIQCEFIGEYSDLVGYIEDCCENGDDAIFSIENDGAVDIADIEGDWRIRVTLTDN